MHTWRKKIKEHIEDCLGRYFSMLLCWTVGVVVGIVFVGQLPLEKTEGLMATMDNFCRTTAQNGVSGSVVWSGLQQPMRCMGLLLLASLSPYLSPLVFVALGGMGFSSGFSVCFLVHQYEWKGLLLAGVSLMPQFLIMLPVLLFAANLCLQRAMEGKRALRFRPLGSDRTMTGGRFTYLFVACIIILIVAVAVEGILCPVFLKIICGWIAA